MTPQHLRSEHNVYGRSSSSEDIEDLGSVELCNLSSVSLLSPEPREQDEASPSDLPKRHGADDKSQMPWKGYKTLPDFDEERQWFPPERTGSLADTLVNPESLADEREATRPGSGLWEHQMLVDRSLRCMATLTALFAIAMAGTCIYMTTRSADKLSTDSRSTAIGLGSGKCSPIKHKSEIFKVFINIAATLVLGMSNTYQQLVTALDVEDLTYVLSKYGDARVGINSPLMINKKRKSRLRCWLCWLLLIFTSLVGCTSTTCTCRTKFTKLNPMKPVHLLANSLVGFAVGRPPLKVESVAVNNATDAVPYREQLSSTSYCIYGLGQEFVAIDPYVMETYNIVNGTKTARLIKVFYNPKWCPIGNYPDYNTTGNVERINPYLSVDINRVNLSISAVENCSHGNVTCKISDHEEQCFLLFRMQAGLILAACLAVKASYMVSMNIYARNRTKTQCLTFGDVLVASRLHSIRLANECMLNGADMPRRRVEHQCHKHCKDSPQSTTGEEVGHCQKCRKFNMISNLTNLPSPILAIKRKKSLASNLGHTALTQMMSLSFCAVGALLCSAYVLASLLHYYYTYNQDQSINFLATTAYFSSMFATAITNEFGAMCIANGPQLLYSTLYLLLIYDFTLINMELEWGKMEKLGARLRCTLVKGTRFDQSYFLQLPKKITLPMIGFSVLTHTLIAVAIQAEETVFDQIKVRESRFTILITPAALFGASALLVILTAVCWVSFTYKRQGFIPSMFGSIRVCCASTADLESIPDDGFVRWGDLGEGPLFRRAGFSSKPVGDIVPNELYAG